MDISETLAPRSDQQNFDDYLAGPRTVTVTAGHVTGNAEQPVSLDLAEYPGRPYKPNKSMRRVIAKFWGTETDGWTGRRLTLFGNPAVKYGGKSVGGIEIGAMSDIGDKPQTMPLTETRGKKRSFTVQPLKDAPAPTQPATPTIPDEVRTNTAKAIANGTIPDYLAWLTEQNAPEYIVNYVQNANKENAQ